MRRSDISWIQELSREVVTCERLSALEKAKGKIKEIARKISAAAVIYNRDECCWRCKQRGHISIADAR